MEDVGRGSQGQFDLVTLCHQRMLQTNTFSSTRRLEALEQTLPKSNVNFLCLIEIKKVFRKSRSGWNDASQTIIPVLMFNSSKSFTQSAPDGPWQWLMLYY